MMQSLDSGIGKVLRALRESGLERDTLVIFTSDNGGERFSYNWPFVGEKNSLWEGGIRVPAIVRWPGSQLTSTVRRPISESARDMMSEPGAVATGSQDISTAQRPKYESAHGVKSEPGAVATGSQGMSNVNSAATGSRFIGSGAKRPPGGRTITLPAITMDWTATILAAAHTDPDPRYPLDGIDLFASTVDGPSSSVAPRIFFWRNGNQDAAVLGPWKYLNDGTREFLFNLAIDQRERADFRDQNPMLFEQLRAEFKKWEATVLPRPVRKP